MKATEILRAVSDRTRIFAAVTGLLGGGALNVDGISTRAKGDITFAVNPSANQTITINGVTFTFVASGAVGNQINIAATLALTLANMTSVLNASVVGGVLLATYSDDAATKLFIKYDAGGSNGNAFTLAASNATVSTANLVGGVDFGDASSGGVTALVTVSGVAYWYRLRSGTDAESSPDIIRPDDYDATAHTRVWELEPIGSVRVLFGNGTEALPSISFVSDTNTGRRRFGADQIADVTGGTDRLLIDSTGVQLASGGAFQFSSGIIGAASDVFLRRNAPNWLEQYNSTNAQSWSLYGTRTDGSNYERLTIKHNGSATGIVFTGEGLGTGTARNFHFIGGSLGIGITTAPLDRLHIVGDGVNAGLRMIGYGSNASVDVRFVAQRANGTVAAPTIVSNNDTVFRFPAQGWDGAAFRSAVDIRAEVDGVPGAGSIPGRLIFMTTPSGSTNPVERLRIDSNGNIGIGASTFGASATNELVMLSGTAPTGNVVDAFQMYSADQAAGNAAPHWRSENGAVYRLFQSTGWTLPTGTASKAGFATSTATLTQVAETLKAVMDHLMTGCSLFSA